MSLYITNLLFLNFLVSSPLPNPSPKSYSFADGIFVFYGLYYLSTFFLYFLDENENTTRQDIASPVKSNNKTPTPKPGSRLSNIDRPASSENKLLSSNEESDDSLFKAETPKSNHRKNSILSNHSAKNLDALEQPIYRHSSSASPTKSNKSISQRSNNPSPHHSHENSNFQDPSQRSPSVRSNHSLKSNKIVVENNETTIGNEEIFKEIPQVNIIGSSDVDENQTLSSQNSKRNSKTDLKSNEES